MSSLTHKKVTIMGLGLHGGAIGTITWAAEQNANITVTDIKQEEQLQKSIAKLQAYSNISFVLGKHEEKDFTDTELVIRNPGVPKASPWLQLARQHNIPIAMDSSLFFSHSASKDIIGITGSKGKTTTATAIAVMLKHVMKETVAVGVDGVSPLGSLSSISADTPVVFELSSWRLEALQEQAVSPATAVVTSIYRDHLNTYDSYEDYIETKKTIFKFQGPKDTTLLNADDAIVRTFADEVPGNLFWYSTSAHIPGNGIYIAHGMVRIRRDEKDIELFSVKIFPTEFEHEQRNMLPAVLIGHLRGMNSDEIQAGLHSIHRLPHRLETVRTYKGVTYVNDSAATMPDAAVMALTSFSKYPIIHIAGGSDKALEFQDLANAQAKVHMKAIIWLPGNATERMKHTTTMAAPEIPMYDALSMEDAVKQASTLAVEGDVVLMSPGATSFGLFLHEFDRGNKFREAVVHLS